MNKLNKAEYKPNVRDKNHTTRFTTTRVADTFEALKVRVRS